MKIELKEQEAQIKLQAFLDDNYRAIRAMRSCVQIVSGGIVTSSGVFEELEDFIEQESNGQLRWGLGTLCEIGDGYVKFEHNHYKLEEEFRADRSVRGFHFVLDLDGAIYDCIDLDFGLSRSHFDIMSIEERRDFMREFGFRRMSLLAPIPRDQFSSLSFVAFLSDSGKRLTIEKLIGFPDPFAQGIRKAFFTIIEYKSQLFQSAENLHFKDYYGSIQIVE